MSFPTSAKMKGYLFTQPQPNVIADNGGVRRNIGVIASSREQAEALVADKGLEGVELVDSGTELVEKLRALGVKIGDVKIL